MSTDEHSRGGALREEVAELLERARYRHRPDDATLLEITTQLPTFFGHEIACRKVASLVKYSMYESSEPAPEAVDNPRLKRAWIRRKAPSSRLIERCESTLDAMKNSETLLRSITLFASAATCSPNSAQACWFTLWASSWHHAVYLAARHRIPIDAPPRHGHSLALVRKALRNERLMSAAAAFMEPPDDDAELAVLALAKQQLETRLLEFAARE